MSDILVLFQKWLAADIFGDDQSVEWLVENGQMTVDKAKKVHTIFCCWVQDGDNIPTHGGI